MMGARLKMLVVAILSASSILVAGAGSAPAEEPPSAWEVVASAPNVGDGFTPVRVWTGEPGVVYVVTVRSTPTYDMVLLRWDGDWTVELDLPGFFYGSIFGTGPDDIYAGFYTCTQPDGSWSCPSSPDGLANKLFHFDGAAWTEQTLPAATNGWQIRSMGGVPGEVHIGVGPYIVRNTGGGWTVVYDGRGGSYTVAPQTMTFLSADEAYITACWGHARWDGVTWTKKIEFAFCDINDVWGARDDTGDLHLWTEGNNNFSNGVRIWKYNEAAQSFGSKFGYEFGDPCCHYGSNLQGNGAGIWGSAWNDVYVVGGRWTPANPYPGPLEGRLYHNDGTGWTPLAFPVDDSHPTDIWGTGPDDIWISLADGGLLHYGDRPEPPPPPTAGSIVGWGEGGWGQLEPPDGLDDVVDISAGGEYHGLALRSDGTVIAWTHAADLPQAIPPSGLSGATAIAAGAWHSLALLGDGTVVGWGYDGSGQATPPAGLDQVVAIDAEYAHSLALRADRTVIGWGMDGTGAATPPAGLDEVVAIDTGYNHSLALRSDGTVVGWGQDDVGQASPPPGLSGVVAISAGNEFSLAVLEDGTVVGWGRDNFGQIDPPAGLDDVVAISAGGWHAVAIRADGTVIGWGRNNFGQISVPGDLGVAVSVSAGDWRTLAIQAAPREFSVTDDFEGAPLGEAPPAPWAIAPDGGTTLVDQPMPAPGSGQGLALNPWTSTRHAGQWRLALATVDTAPIADVSVAADLSVGGWNGAFGGIVLRYQDPDNYWVAGTSAPFGQQRSIWLARVDDGVWTDLGWAVMPRFSPYAGSLEAKAIGDTLEVFWSGTDGTQEFLRVEDPGSGAVAGQVGVVGGHTTGSSNQPIWFDDVVALPAEPTSISETVPPTQPAPPYIEDFETGLPAGVVVESQLRVEAEKPAHWDMLGALDTDGSALNVPHWSYDEPMPAPGDGRGVRLDPWNSQSHVGQWRVALATVDTDDLVDVSIAADLSLEAWNGAFGGVVLRYLDPANYWIVGITAPFGQQPSLILAAVDDGEWVELGSAPLPRFSSFQGRLEGTAAGDSFEVFWNGTDGTQRFLRLEDIGAGAFGGRVGVIAGYTTGSSSRPIWFDNVAVDETATTFTELVQPTTLPYSEDFETALAAGVAVESQLRVEADKPAHWDMLGALELDDIALAVPYWAFDESMPAPGDGRGLRLDPFVAQRHVGQWRVAIATLAADPVADVSVGADLSLEAWNNAFGGIVLRYEDMDNYWIAGTTAPFGAQRSIWLARVVGGEWIDLGSTAMPRFASFQGRLEATATGDTFEVYWTGADDTQAVLVVPDPGSGSVAGRIGAIAGYTPASSSRPVWFDDYVAHAPDRDGVPPAVEDGAPNGGDGNADGIPDREQEHVTSLPNAVTGSYLVLESPEGTRLVDVEAVVNPSPGPIPPEAEFPIGFVSFAVAGVEPGGSTVVTLTVPEPDLDVFYRYGPTATAPDHWYRFGYDPLTGTGAVVTTDPASTTFELHLSDGGRGDSDLTADGTIVDPGGPGRLLNHPPTAVADDYTTDEDTVLDVAAPGVLGNDVDPDGDVLDATLATGPGTGDLTLGADGSFGYDPLGSFQHLGAGASATESFTYTARDPFGESSTATATITVAGVNDEPVLSVDATTVTVPEGAVATNAGSFGDIDAGDAVEVSASAGVVVIDRVAARWTWTLPTTDGPADSQSVTVTATDDSGAATAVAFDLTVDNVAPTITSVAGPVGPVAVGVPVTVTVGYTDPGAESHEVASDWGDGNSDTLSDAPSPAAASHAYTTPGVYVVELGVTDEDGGWDSSSFTYVVVYDPDGGFVTGGGHLRPDGDDEYPGVADGKKANFGFNARYQHGEPDGHLNAHLGDLHVELVDLAWLALADDWALFQGTATIDGSDDVHPIEVLATESGGPGGSDTFRLRVWAPGDDPRHDAHQYQLGGALDGGKIQIHR